MQWIFKNKEFTKNDVLDNWIGFVYLITLTSQSGEKKYYIGKKNFFTMAKQNLAKKDISEDKRKKTYRRKKTFTFEKYNGSSKALLELVEQGWEIKKNIIRICKTKGELTYYEVFYQMKYNALLSDKFLNDNILGKFYKKHFFENN